MKIRHRNARWGHRACQTIFAILASTLLAGTAKAQSYGLDWHTIDGGGGTSTGSVYRISGTIGQPEAGTMTGGTFELQGGFWGVAAGALPQTPPSLTVVRIGQAVVLSWASPASGWVLEAADALPQSSTAWAQIPPPYETNGANLQFTEVAPAGTRFYRLRKP